MFLTPAPVVCVQKCNLWVGKCIEKCNNCAIKIVEKCIRINKHTLSRCYVLLRGVFHAVRFPRTSSRWLFTPTGTQVTSVT